MECILERINIWDQSFQEAKSLSSSCRSKHSLKEQGQEQALPACLPICLPTGCTLGRLSGPPLYKTGDGGACKQIEAVDRHFAVVYEVLGRKIACVEGATPTHTLSLYSLGIPLPWTYEREGICSRSFHHHPSRRWASDWSMELLHSFCVTQLSHTRPVLEARASCTLRRGQWSHKARDLDSCRRFTLVDIICTTWCMLDFKPYE